MSVPRLSAALSLALLLCGVAFGSASAAEPPPLTVSAELRDAGPDASGNRAAVLTVTVTPPDGFYVYSLRGTGDFTTKLNVAGTPGLEPLDDRFTPDRAPTVKPDPVTFESRETFTGPVRWSRRYRVTEPATAAVTGTVGGQYCSTGTGGVCVPIRPVKRFAATLAPATLAPDANSPAAAAAPKFGEKQLLPFTHEDRPDQFGQAGRAAVSVTLSPDDARPGETVTASVSLALDDGWHTYSTTQPKDQPAVPTKIAVEALRGLTPAGPFFRPTEPPETVRQDLGPEQVNVLEEYHGTPVWTRKFTVTDAGADGYGLRGSVKYQLCDANTCLPPNSVEFALGRVDAAKDFTDMAPPRTSRAAALAAAGPAHAAGGHADDAADGDEGAGDLVEDFASARPAKLADLWANLPLAFVAGLLLNVMPCVLPVIAIKVLGFVKQAGEDRRTVAVLNLSYVAGVMAVFGTFALLSLGLYSALNLGDEFGFGDQFNSAPVRVAMTCVIFALGLCLLGVFEIPLPGFLGTAAGGSPREGLFGAFTGGVFTTLLATPCTGPYMLTVLGYAAKIAAVSKLASVAVWLSMGLGFAAPYLLFALSPAAVRVLPKPGNWMVRFKEFGGLTLMGFALFMLSALDPGWWMPVLITLLGIALAAWMVGSLYQHNTPAGRKWLVRGLAAASLGLCMLFGWGYVGPEDTLAGGPAVARGDHELPWEPFSEARLRELRREGRTVLIDFTSATCVNCKVNEGQALNTAATRALVEHHDVVPLQAWIDRSDEAYAWLRKLDAYGVPLTAIFRGNAPNEAPIRLGGVYTEATLHEKLREAVGAGDVKRTAGL